MKGLQTKKNFFHNFAKNSKNPKSLQKTFFKEN